MIRILIIIAALSCFGCSNSFKEKLGAMPPYDDKYSLRDPNLVVPPFIANQEDKG